LKGLQIFHSNKLEVSLLSLFLLARICNPCRYYSIVLFSWQKRTKRSRLGFSSTFQRLASGKERTRYAQTAFLSYPKLRRKGVPTSKPMPNNKIAARFF